MNLRIPDPSGLVEALHHLLDRAAEPVLPLEGWTVVTLRERYFYHGRCPEGELEVAGPYPTLGALVRDAGRIHHAEHADPPGREPIWEVIEWAGAWFTVRAGEFANPGMHATQEEAMEAGRRAT